MADQTKQGIGKPPEGGAGTAADWLPKQLTLEGLKEAASDCRACPLWERGTQTVFGDGAGRSEVMLVGEQPGNSEDLEGRPFVGPAGRLLDVALERARIDRSAVYVTNVVKHFKWISRGKRRIHSKPNGSEIRACRPWLEAEIQSLRPKVIVCLGATAAQALLGPKFRLTQHRGEPIESPWAPYVFATVHPSSILRAPDEQTRHREMDLLVEDLEAVGSALRTAPISTGRSKNSRARAKPTE